MTSVDILPDAELITIDYLLAQPSMTATVGSRVATSSPSNPVYPYLVVERIGGVPLIAARLDNARLQVSAWGATRKSAHDTAQLARSLLHRMRNYQHPAGVVAGVEDDLGLAWLPDTARTPATPRFVFAVRVGARVP